MAKQHIIDQLEKMSSEFNHAKSRLEFLKNQDMSEKTRNQINKYITAIDNLEQKFFKSIKKTL